MIGALEGLLPILPRTFEDAVCVSILGPVIFGVASEDPVPGADVLVDLENPVVEVVPGDVVRDEEILGRVTLIGRLCVGFGLKAEDLLGNRIEPGRGDDISGERIWHPAPGRAGAGSFGRGVVAQYGGHW